MIVSDWFDERCAIAVRFGRAELQPITATHGKDRMSRRHLAALALVATTLAASGCGGSAGSSGSLTRSELIARGDAICRRINAKLRATTVTSARDYARLAPPLAAYEQAAVAEMRKLTPPASMANGWNQVVSGAQMLADGTAKLGQYAQRSNPFQAHQTPSVHAAFVATAEGMRQMVAAAQREGFNDCAQTP
jgi:hypothetical protein